MKKYLKKSLQVFIWIIGSLLLFFLLTIVSLQIPYVQNYAKEKVVTYIEQKIKTKFKVDTLTIQFPKKIILKGVYLEDQKKDTLFAGEKLAVNISLFELISNKVEINSFTEDFYKNLQQNGFHNLNLQSTGGILENRIGEVDQNRLIQMYAFIATSPGIPNIFYGDEISLKGDKPFNNLGNMQFSGLNLKQENLKNTIAKLNKIRASRLDLMYGDTQILAREKDYLVLARNYLDKTTIIIFNLADEQKEITFELPYYTQNKNYFAEFGNDVMFNRKTLTIILRNRELEILTSQ